MTLPSPRVTVLKLGTIFDSGRFKVFFGNKDANFPSLQLAFEYNHWRKIKQVHGDNLVQASKYENDSVPVEADAHWSQDLGNTLLISTADCAPIMIIDHKTKRYCAIHAGWRGVENSITKKCLKEIFSESPESLQVFIGPHIQLQSFEIENKYRDSLIKTVDQEISQKSVMKFATQSKLGYSLVDLRAILIGQIQSFSISREQIFTVDEDTRSNLEYHSFRRDREKSGRQLSFVSLQS